MGMTFTGYLNKLRLERSLSPLLNTRMSIESVAELCGFRDARAYTRFFKLQYGMLPSRYRKLHSDSFAGGLEEAAGPDSQALKPLYAASIMDNISSYFETAPELLHSVQPVRPDDGLISISMAKSAGRWRTASDVCSIWDIQKHPLRRRSRTWCCSSRRKSPSTQFT